MKRGTPAGAAEGASRSRRQSMPNLPEDIKRGAFPTRSCQIVLGKCSRGELWGFVRGILRGRCSARGGSCQVTRATETFTQLPEKPIRSREVNLITEHGPLWSVSPHNWVLERQQPVSRC